MQSCNRCRRQQYVVVTFNKQTKRSKVCNKPLRKTACTPTWQGNKPLQVAICTSRCRHEIGIRFRKLRSKIYIPEHCQHVNCSPTSRRISPRRWNTGMAGIPTDSGKHVPDTSQLYFVTLLEQLSRMYGSQWRSSEGTPSLTMNRAMESLRGAGSAYVSGAFGSFNSYVVVVAQCKHPQKRHGLIPRGYRWHRGR